MLKSDTVFPGESANRGITLRDHIAIQVLVSLIERNNIGLDSDMRRNYSKAAYLMADEMLEQRKK